MPEEQRVTPGQPIKTNPLVRHANTINSVLDMNDRFRAQGYLGSPGDKNRRGDMGTDEVQVRNMTGANRRLGDVVQLNGFILDEKVYPHLWFDCRVPDSGLRRVAILRQPLSTVLEPEIGRAQVSGVCIARFDTMTGDGDWATPVANSHELTVAPSGPFEMLSTIVDGLAVVRFHTEGEGLTLLRLEEELLVGSSASARIVDETTLETIEGEPVTLVDDERKWFGRGDPAPSGDTGGDLRIDGTSYSNLYWAQRMDAGGSGTGIYSAVSGGTWYRWIKGVLSADQATYPWRVYIEADIDRGWDGDTSLSLTYDYHFVRPDTTQDSGVELYLTLDGICIAPADGYVFVAVFNEIRRAYQVVTLCCPTVE